MTDGQYSVQMWAIMAMILFIFSCGDVPSKMVQDEPEGLPDGYWETQCRCQHKPFPIDEGVKRGYKCASKFRQAHTCEMDTPIWCGTGNHWGYRCEPTK